MTLRERFDAKWVANPTTGCWDWTASKRDGYGQIASGDGRVPNAHRVGYELYVGPIPGGLDLDHLCRNRGCVNPAHLEPVTRKVNLLRGDTIPARNAAKTRCSKGHEYGPKPRRDRQNRRICSECNIITCRRWREDQRAAA